MKPAATNGERERTWMLLEEIAAQCEVSRSTVLKWISNGRNVEGRRVRLKASRMVGRLRVERADLTAFLAICNSIPVAKNV